MFLKQDSNFVLQAKLAGTVVTSQVEISLTYSDNTDKHYADVIVATNNTTPVTLLQAPASGVVNLIESIKIYNPDTQVITVQILAGNIIIYTCTVNANQSLILSETGISNSFGCTPLAANGDGRNLTNITPSHVNGNLGTYVVAYNTSTQSLPAGIYTKIIMPATYENARNEWNTNNSSWTVTDRGSYLFGILLSFSSTTPSLKKLCIYLNGSPWQEHKIYCADLVYSYPLSAIPGSVLTFYINCDTDMTVSLGSALQIYNIEGF